MPEVGWCHDCETLQLRADMKPVNPDHAVVMAAAAEMLGVSLGADIEGSDWCRCCGEERWGSGVFPVEVDAHHLAHAERGDALVQGTCTDPSCGLRPRDSANNYGGGDFAPS